MIVRGPRYGSILIAASGGFSAAAPMAPTIAHSIQAGKFAPAMLTTGSHPESANAVEALIAVSHVRENRRLTFTAAKIARKRS